MRKRILSIGLSVALGISFLAACNNNTDTDTSDGSSTTSSEQVDDSEESTTVEETTTEETTVEETTEETTVDETEETTVEETEETTVDGGEQTEGTWETDENGKILLPELVAAEFNVMREVYEPGAESEEAALVRLEDFSLDFTDEGALITNNSDQLIFEVFLELSANGGEATADFSYYSPVNAGQSIPSLITPEIFGTELTSGALDPETTDITGMFVRVYTSDGYQEVQENYQGGEGSGEFVSTAHFEPYGIVDEDVENVAIQADEVDFNIEANGETLSVTVTNNSEYPLTTIGFALDAPDLEVVWRNINPEFTINVLEVSDTALYPGESVTQEFVIDSAIIEREGATVVDATDQVPMLADLDAQNWSVTAYFITVGTEDNPEAATVGYDYVIGNYSQTNLFDGE